MADISLANSPGIVLGATEPNNNTVYHVNGSPSIKQARKKGLPWILAALVFVFLVLLGLLFYFFLIGLPNHSAESPAKSADALRESDWPRPSQRSLLARFARTAVVSDNGICSEIGRSVLLRGGNAVDAAIATASCVGGLHTHSSGLGGGFLMVYYDSREGRCRTLDAREAAPLAANKDTFVGKPSEAFHGPKSIATPGELHGYWTAFKRFSSGRIPWQELIMPTVRLLNHGYPVTQLMEANLRQREAEILASASMRGLFHNNRSGRLYREGELLKNPVLGETYRKLAVSTDPVRLFYRSELADTLVAELAQQGALLTKRDLELYRTRVDEQPVQNERLAPGLVLCGPKPSSSFAVTQLILAVMARFYPQGSAPRTLFNDPLFYHRFVEAQKFAFAQRTKLGRLSHRVHLPIAADPEFVAEVKSVLANMTSAELVDEIVAKIGESALESGEYGADQGQLDDKGTSHISVVDADGNSVSMTSSVNNIFGALIRSERLGIVYNDQMDDFSVPGSKNFFGFEPAKANLIEPGKRPLSSMSPLIVYDRSTKAVRASVGAAGGSKIISAVAQVLLQVLSFNRTAKEAIDFPRLHNQFTPIQTAYEKGFPEVMLSALRSQGHNLTEMSAPFSTVQAIFRDADGKLSASTDYRRPVYMYPTGF